MSIAGLSVDGGTLIYPLTFTLRDLVHKATGIKGARTVIVAAAAINLLMAGLFQLISRLPPDMTIGLQLEWGRVLAPIWRITLASIASEVVSELADTEAYQWWVTRVTVQHEWARVLVSNCISEPLDSLMFCWLAFGGTMPAATVWSIVLANVIIKLGMTLLGLPMIYLVRPQVERA